MRDDCFVWRDERLALRVGNCDVATQCRRGRYEAVLLAPVTPRRGRRDPSRLLCVTQSAPSAYRMLMDSEVAVTMR
jgi:hypothetical protein